MSDQINFRKELELTEEGHSFLNEFEEYIVESLIQKGFSRQELVGKFNEAKRNIGWTSFCAVEEDNSK